MNIETKATKLYLKNLAPIEVYDKLDEYKIPSPYKEILISACVYNKECFEGCDFLEENYKIRLGYWNFVKKLKEALIVFRKSHIYKNNPKLD